MKIFTTLTLLALCSITLANQTSFFCPKTNSLIKLGDRLETVIDRCGPPTSLSQSNDITPSTMQGEQWVYHFQNTPKAKKPYKTVKLGLVANIVDKKIVNLFVQGKAVQSTYYCDSVNAIKVGDYQALLWHFCGKPSVIRPVKIFMQRPPESHIVAQYGDNAITATELTFTDGVLKSIRT